MNLLSFKAMKFFAKFFVSSLFISISYQLTSIGIPCYPTDPTGSNPRNPCLVFPPSGINANTFVQGIGRPVREIPTLMHPAGKEILRPAGFWSGSTTSGQQRVIRDSSGGSYTLPTQ